MIKRLVWTLILLMPTLAIGFLSIVTNNGIDPGAFSAIQSLIETTESFGRFLFEEGRLLGFIGDAIISTLLIMPFIFVWRGLFLLKIIPVVGSGLRIMIITIIILLPLIMNVDDIEQEVMGWIHGIVLLLALIGVWMPKKITK